MIAWNKGLTKETDERVMRYASKGKDKKRLAHLGKKRSLQTKKNISNALKGKKKTEIHKKRVSVTLKKRYQDGSLINPFTGKKHTQKTILHFKQVHKGIWTQNKNPKWKGGISFVQYGYEWNNNLKEQIRRRDQYKCQICKEKQKIKKIDVHHIDENKKNNNPTNLISLCHYCHILIHNKKIRLYSATALLNPNTVKNVPTADNATSGQSHNPGSVKRAASSPKRIPPQTVLD